MTTVTEADVTAALQEVVDPAKGTDIVSAGMTSGIVVEGDRVRFVIEVDPARGANMQPLARAAEKAVMALPGITKALAILTADTSGRETPAPPAPP